MEDQCVAVTNAGKRCPIDSVYFSLLCHVHEPTLQCGAKKRNGVRCNAATGGVRCKYHPLSKYASHT